MNKIVTWILVFALQVFVFNHLNFTSYLVPQVFIFLLIILPLHLSKLNIVLIGFGLGLLADIFTSTAGLHASACLWLVLIRMAILNSLDTKQMEANKNWFTVQNVGLPVFFYTTIALVFVYHLYVFFLGSIGAIDFERLLISTFASTSFALLIILFFELVSFGRSK